MIELHHVYSTVAAARAKRPKTRHGSKDRRNVVVIEGFTRHLVNEESDQRAKTRR
jgi:hypothetical protein